MRKVIYIIFVFTLITSCNPAETNPSSGTDLDAKNQALIVLKDEQTDIARKIVELEAEIVKLDPSKAIQPKLVAVAEIKTEGFDAYINLQGVVSSENISYVAPRNGAGGYVKELHIKEGQFVKKGQLVLKLDDQVLRQSIESTKTQLAFANDIYQRTKSLWDQKIGTEVQLLTAKNNVDGLTNQIAIQEEQLNTYLVYADQNGIAEIVNIKTGELFTGIGPAGPQIQIINNRDLSVHVDIPQNYTLEVKTGSEVLVHIAAIDKTFKTKIQRISQSVNPSSSGFKAICQIPSTAGLKPNMAASIKILSHSNPKAVVIPVNIIQSDEVGKYVFLMDQTGEQKLAKKVNVKLGDLYGDQIEILDGLQPGDQLVTKGYQDLYEGQVLNNI
ncbi:MAG: efflux RND transporter periplasmic adaptor subunit [Saprospiraceae bacterium]|nr:efflux RND transporter periplasmic adaptor subunit [Saprospiraceae bacterium]